MLTLSVPGFRGFHLRGDSLFRSSLFFEFPAQRYMFRCKVIADCLRCSGLGVWFRKTKWFRAFHGSHKITAMRSTDGKTSGFSMILIGQSWNLVNPCRVLIDHHIKVLIFYLNDFPILLWLSYSHLLYQLSVYSSLKFTFTFFSLHSLYPPYTPQLNKIYKLHNVDTWLLLSSISTLMTCPSDHITRL